MKKIAFICNTQITDYNFSKIKIEYIYIDESVIENALDVLKFLLKNIDKLTELDGILIDASINIDIRIYLALYIRLNSEWKFDDKPLVILTNENYDYERLIQRKIEGKNSFIPSINTKFMTTDVWDLEGFKNDLESHFIKYNYFSENRFNRDQYIIVEHLGNNHQVANEWGAYKLAHIAGLSHLLSIIEQQQPASKTLYFKYLKRKENITINTEGGIINTNTAINKYLYIDDNYNKGWELVFNAIFQQINPNLGIESFTEIPQNENEVANSITQIIENIESNKYQGVLLDLRLIPSDDDHEKTNTKITEFTGGRILRELKERFPFLPIIMVTASNKAWNMQQLLDAGADGYFIKEDPESNPNEEISKNSYEAFKELIVKCQDKYKQLEPFWKYIEEIENKGTLIQERADTNGNITIVEKRIKERLKMFFGLLKRSFEDSKFNKRFYYSDIELAFMTLWSCLNDIQFIYYEKQGDSTYKINSSLVSHFSITNTPNDYQFLTFLDENKLKTRIKENTQNKTFDFDMSNKENGKKIKYYIGQLIAFLIFAFASDSTKRDDFLKKLFLLKEKRNHLYLTHGDENTDDFFQKLEANNNELTLTECVELFEIIYFLLKGVFIKI